MTYPVVLWGDLADAAMVIDLRQCVARQQAARARAWDVWAKAARRQWRIELQEERRARTRPSMPPTAPEFAWQEQWFSREKSST